MKWVSRQLWMGYLPIRDTFTPQKMNIGQILRRPGFFHLGLVPLAAIWVACAATSQAQTILANFSGTDESTPCGDLTLIGSTLYGTTYYYGVDGYGTVFSVPVAGGKPTTLATFNMRSGAYPCGSLTLIGSSLYGTTQQGGSSDFGTVFSVPVTGGAPTTLATFSGTNGQGPTGSLTLIGDTLYGTTYGSGYANSGSYGTVFSVPVAGGEPTTLATFNGANGAHPNANLTLIGSTLYGTTRGGDGGDGYGRVFSVPVGGGAPTTVAAFDFTNGAYPCGSLTLIGNILYGTTEGNANPNADNHRYGTVFSTPVGGGSPTTLATFNKRNGAYPCGSLTLVGNKLFGTTLQGGAHDFGTVFSVPVGGGAPATLVTFDKSNGAYPVGSLALFGKKLYGTTQGDVFDNSPEGTVFSIPAPEPNELTVAVNDSLEGATNYPASSRHMLTEPLTITAHPNAGYVFGAWNAIDANGPVAIADPHLNPLKLPMTDNLSVTANFVASPFLTSGGAYYGILKGGPDAYSNGAIELSLTSQGAFTGTVTVRGKRFALSGLLDDTGYWTKTFDTGLTPPYASFTLTLQENFTTTVITGALSNSHSDTATWNGTPIPVYNRAHPSPIQGTYTLALPPQTPRPTPTSPQGAGYAILRVSSLGVASFLGRLADGSLIAASVPLDDANTGSYSISLHANGSYLAGALTFSTAVNPSAANDVETSAVWSRPADTASKIPSGTPWTAGWTTTLAGFGSVYTSPAPSAYVLSQFTNGTANFSVTEGISFVFATSVTIQTNNTIMGAGGLSASLNSTLVNPSTLRALVGGGFVHGQLPAVALNSSAKPSATFGFSGVVLQRQGEILGQVIFKDASGDTLSDLVEILP